MKAFICLQIIRKDKKMVWVEKFADVIKKMNSTIEERHHD
jgi:hypothetical protein